MQVIKGKYSGFCFGVERAIKTAYGLEGNNNYILGELIHNDKVLEDLKQKGLKTISSIDEVNLNENDKLLIRTHGEPKEVFKKLEKNNVNIIDCTCPFVKDIQKIVENHYNKGYQILIVGNPNHPEVIGINGWCENSAVITENPKDLESITAEKICVVVQTTYSGEKFDDFVKKINVNASKTVDIFKTICYTTNMRRREAERLSKACECVIVIGGAKSNNTQKLFELCKSINDNTFRIVDPSSFDFNQIKNFKKVGIVFGASTPSEQFQEVIQIMEEVVTEEIIINESKPETEGEKTVKSEMEAAFNSIKPSKDLKIGQIIVAKISSANETGLTVSLKNTKKDFELPADEMLNKYNKEDYKDKIGSDIKLMVIAKNPMKFSEKALQKIIQEDAEIEEIKSGKIFEATVTATNKGGLTAKFGRYSIFIPSSQIRLGFVNDLDKYIGKTLRLKAEKVETKRKQIVASQRVILEEEKKERDAIRAQKESEFFGAIQEGDIILGTPVRFADFGAFVDVNGFDCLVHISDLAWSGCKNCAEVLEIGKQYEFKILKIDSETKRVSLGYKQLQPKPWETVLERYKIGDVIKGKVVRIVKFGAFIEVEKGIDGLVHVSQITNKWLDDPVKALQVGQEIDAKILNIDVEKEKMNLSIKVLLPEEPEENVEGDNDEKPKAKKRAKKEEPVEDELHEWKDETDNGVSIADLLNK